jgi:hypothetical protein
MHTDEEEGEQEEIILEQREVKGREHEIKSDDENDEDDDGMIVDLQCSSASSRKQQS